MKHKTNYSNFCIEISVMSKMYVPLAERTGLVITNVVFYLNMQLLFTKFLGNFCFIQTLFFDDF